MKEKRLSRNLPRFRYFWAPLLAIGILSVMVLGWNLDLQVSGYFWDTDLGWRLKDHPLFVFLYRLGPVPGICAGIGGLAMWLLFWRTPEYRVRRQTCWILVLLIALGPGLIVNAIFKEHYGRPRPRSVEAFGGDEKFVPLFVYNPDGRGKSFPSGHASIGFFWLGLVPWVSRLHRHGVLRSGGWVYLFLFLGILQGGLMSFGRIAQGGHFLSDVSWSAAIDYYLGLGLALFFSPQKKQDLLDPSPLDSTDPDGNSSGSET